MVHRSKDNHLDEILALIDHAHKLAMANDEHIVAFILQMASLEASHRIEKTSEEEA